MVEQPLHPVGGGIAGLLGQLPAILAFDRAEEPAQERPGVPADLASGEPGCDPGDERVQFGRPSLDLGQCSFHLPPRS
jgi:hypothetical protein